MSLILYYTTAFHYVIEQYILAYDKKPLSAELEIQVNECSKTIARFYNSSNKSGSPFVK